MSENQFVIWHNTGDISYSDSSLVIQIQAYDERWKNAKPNIESDLISIKKNRNITKISLSGMKQKDFEYVLQYIPDYEIHLDLFKCPDIIDFSPLEQLENIKEIFIYWNRKATKLWNLSKNRKLIKLNMINCNKITEFSNLKNSFVEDLSLHGCNYLSSFTPKLVIDDMNNLFDIPNLKILSFSVVKNYDIEKVLLKLSTLKNLRELRFLGNEFTFEQFAWLKSKLPNVQGLEGTNGMLYTVIGKGKPKIFSNISEDKINIYKEKYEELVAYYLNIEKPPM